MPKLPLQLPTQPPTHSAGCGGCAEHHTEINEHAAVRCTHAHAEAHEGAHDATAIDLMVHCNPVSGLHNN
eukprot:82214-Pelagomonas_calceolata.AAC.5